LSDPCVFNPSEMHVLAICAMHRRKKKKEKKKHAHSNTHTHTAVTYTHLRGRQRPEAVLSSGLFFFGCFAAERKGLLFLEPSRSRSPRQALDGLVWASGTIGGLRGVWEVCVNPVCGPERVSLNAAC